MDHKLLFLGVDVDDNAFHVSGIFEEDRRERFIEFKTKPNAGALSKKLEGLQKEGFEVRLCYEATYLGFSLCRELKKRNIHCDVIAPTSIPVRNDKTVKNDRIDAKELVQFYKSGHLTIVSPPDENEEYLRDILRSRTFVQEQLGDLKRHILALCRRAGINYKQSENAKSYFTDLHLNWLIQQIELKKNPSLYFNIRTLLSQKTQLDNQLILYQTEIERQAAEPRYLLPVQSLICYRGFSVLSAMSLITELGDIRRFKHPRALTSYAGMDLREYSSGGKSRRYSMSKLGNRRIRTVVIEAAQSANKIPQIGRSLSKRRMGMAPEFIGIADRAMHRLHQKTMRLILSGKHVNIAKAAGARELLGFVWESLNLATKIA